MQTKSESEQISIEVAIPEEIYESIASYLNEHSDWSVDRVAAAAFSLFLLQNGCSTSPESPRNYRRAARVYLDSLFQRSA